MTDYIEREAAIELLSQPITMSMCLSTEECHHKIAQQRIDRYLIEDIPAANVRPVVQCKDCKHSERWYADKSRCFLWHESGIDVFNDGFCNYGVKREEN